MNVAWWFWMENWGGIDNSVEMGLDPNHSYLVEVYLVKKDGGDYAHAYIAQVCSGGRR
jgi:hypothetical protein